MPAIKRIWGEILLFGFFVAFSFGIGWAIPFLQKSAFFHGLMVIMGILTLPVWFVIDATDDRRPFPKDAFVPRFLLLTCVVSVSFFMILFGISFWNPMLRFSAYAFLAVFLLTFLVTTLMAYQETRKQGSKRVVD